MNNDSEVIDGYLNIKKYTRDKFREIKRSLLEKENFKLKTRIIHTKSVINNRVLSDEFKKLKKISNYLRKVKPQDSVGNIYLNRKESQIIRKYEKEKADYFLKTKEKESLTKRRNVVSSADERKISGYKTTNKLNKTPFNIDRKILRKIAYV